MNNEIKEILDFKEDADYKRLSVDEITILRDYITKLERKIEDYEMFDNQEIGRLNNIIKEVREYIEYNSYDFGTDSFTNVNDILQILDKEKQNETTI